MQSTQNRVENKRKRRGKVKFEWAEKQKTSVAFFSRSSIIQLTVFISFFSFHSFSSLVFSLIFNFYTIHWQPRVCAANVLCAFVCKNRILKLHCWASLRESGFFLPISKVALSGNAIPVAFVRIFTRCCFAVLFCFLNRMLLFYFQFNSFNSFLLLHLLIFLKVQYRNDFDARIVKLR